MAILDKGWQSGGVYAPPLPRQVNKIKYFSFNDVLYGTLLYGNGFILV